MTSDLTNRAPDPGLCSTCRWKREVSSRTGSGFILCRKSQTDPGFPRYPVLPVRECPGHEPERRASRDA